MVTLNKKESAKFLKKMLHTEQRHGLTPSEKRTMGELSNKKFDWIEFDKELMLENMELERWVTDNYGPRCPKYLKDCVVCEKWRLFDKLKLDI